MSGRQGFNLVEVVLAMAVIGVAFTSLFGVMPVALENYRHSMNMAMQANILSQLSAELTQTPTAKLFTSSSYIAPERYFDDEGQDVTSTPARALFHAKFREVQLTVSGGSSTPPVYATQITATVFDSTDSATSPLIPVTVDIYAIHGGVDVQPALVTHTFYLSSY